MNPNQPYDLHRNCVSCGEPLYANKPLSIKQYCNDKCRINAWVVRKAKELNDRGN